VLLLKDDVSEQMATLNWVLSGAGCVGQWWREASR
jgi:hypothetical protein